MNNTLQIILGLGKTGLSCVRYLAKNYNNIIVCDTREQPPNLAEFKREFPNLPLHLGALSAELLCQAERIIISPGLSLHEPAIASAIKQGIPVIGDIELFLQATKRPVVGITGTNAKGTVTTMLGLMAEQAGINVVLGGNIGTPALELLEQPQAELYILELSSFQLESTHSLRAKAATILNISPDHLDHHHGMEEYIAAKQVVYQQAENCVYNRADRATYPLLVDQAICWSFALDKPANDHEFGIVEQYLSCGEQQLMPVKDLKVVGSHNVENALAALALGTALGLPKEAMVEALRSFTGLPHRCQLVRELNEIRWYNDSKATNIGAAIAALKGFANDLHEKLWLIAGGDGKGADFDLMREIVSQTVDNVILFGKDADKIAASWQTYTTIIHVNNLLSAVDVAAQLASSGDIVLLAPACSSLDMFKDFEQRGDIFTDLVKKL